VLACTERKHCTQIDSPGHIHHATILDISPGLGQARVGSIGGANAFPAQISLPEDMDRERLRLSMPGSATVFADNAGVIGLIMSIQVWVRSAVASVNSAAVRCR
jgi:hypothetical protein